MKVEIPGRKRKIVAQLIDPDRAGEEWLAVTTRQATESKVDLFLAGGSLTNVPIDQVIRSLKKLSDIPVVLFPGNLTQLTDVADAIFLLSLISGRNPELLIGNHVIAAPFLKQIRDRVIPVGYILIDCGGGTSVEYMSQTSPIPYGKNDIAAATAIAGEMLGLKAIYLEGGSGAARHVNPSMIREVRAELTLPLIVGGGLDSADKVDAVFAAGADMVVIGNGSEQNPGLIKDVCRVRDSHNRNLLSV